MLQHLAILIAFVRGVLLVDGIKLLRAGDLVLHPDVIVLFISTQDLDLYITVGDFGLDFDGEVGVVLELEVGITPADSGIHAVVNVVGNKAVVDAEDDLQVSNQGAIVQSGGDLADAAADGIDQLVAGVGGSGLVALLFGTLAQGFVEGEFLTRLQDHAVQGLAGQPQVGVPVLVVGVGGLTGTQHILEQNVVLQNGGGNILHGNAHGGAVLRVIHKLLGLFYVKSVAIDAGNGLEGLHIDRGIHRGDVQLLVNGLHVQRIGGALGGDFLHLHQELGHAVGIQNILENLVNVQTQTGGADGDHQSLAGGGFIEFVHLQNGHFALQGIGRLGQDGAELIGIILQGQVDVLLVQLQIGQQADGVVGAVGSLVGCLPLFLGAGTSVAVGGLDGCFDIQGHAGVGRGQADGLIGKGDDHVAAVGAGQVLCYGILCLAAGHAAHVDAGDGHVVQDLAVIGVGSAADKDSGDGTDNQNQYQSAGPHQNHLLILAEKGHGLFQESGFVIFVLRLREVSVCIQDGIAEGLYLGIYLRLNELGDGVGIYLGNKRRDRFLRDQSFQGEFLLRKELPGLLLGCRVYSLAPVSGLGKLTFCHSFSSLLEKWGDNLLPSL